ncbi:MAG: trypsin-like peptidase domain-containing protein [Chloroflexi bacterium]|nr:trypsin-like peptidase domain-containing protein [Chloroflexota bacterium]
MKKALSYIATFVLSVAVAVTSMLLIHDSKAEPTPIPEPTPIVIEKEVIKEIPVEVVKEVIKEVEVIRPTDLEKVVKDCKNSCVMIYAYKDNIINQGSGWVYNGYIVTAKHVVDGYKKIEVYTDDTDNPRMAQIYYVDDKLDLAILKASIMLPSLTLGDSSKLTEGEKLVSITSPMMTKNAIDECVYSGMVSTLEGTFLVITESNMSGGSSGGAVLDYNSKIIGMVISGDSGGHHVIRINDIKPILENLK